jgi:adenosylmethionine---8-amino-7-oxononanoate aminotransferase
VDEPGADDGLTGLVERDQRVLWHPYAPPVADPLFGVVDARGTRLTLEDGRVVVDGMSSWWAAIHGYRHPVLDAALHAQVDRFAHVMFGGLTHEPAVSLAELLVSVTPEPLTRVFFADSGSVAVEVALKMAVQATGIPRVLAVRGGYHGDTAGAMSVTDPEGMHGLFAGWVVEQVFVPRPRPLYDESCTDEDLAPVVQALEAQPVAAVVVEPVVQGAGTPPTTSGGSSRSAASAGCSSSSTRSPPASAAPASCGAWTTPTWCRTSCASARPSPAAP